MNSTFGNVVKVSLFGESHGEAVGALIGGLPSGLSLNKEIISSFMRRRKSTSSLSTDRCEEDEVHFISGEKDGFSSGAPIAFTIENKNVNNSDYADLEGKVRPGHADYTQIMRYGDFAVTEGGGHLSGRLTAPLCAVGAILTKMLNDKGIKIVSHVKQVGNVYDGNFNFNQIEKEKKLLFSLSFPMLDEKAREAAEKLILEKKAEGDSIGAVIECAVTGIPVGVGEPLFDSLEGVIAHAVFSVPAVKGIEFGKGFRLAEMTGSEANDPFYIKDGRTVCEKNDMGGVLGGMADGMPLVFSVVIKPTPSIKKEQNTADVKTGKEVKISVGGRHDPCIAVRACPCIESAAAIAVCDLLCVKYGIEFFGNKR